MCEKIGPNDQLTSELSQQAYFPSLFVDRPVEVFLIYYLACKVCWNVVQSAPANAE